MQTASPPTYDFGDFRVDPVKRTLLRRDGVAVPLTPRVFDTLLYMVEHHGVVLDKERMMEAVWHDSIVEENNLTQNISTLRRIFGETPGSHRFIVTVPGRGYRFVAAVKEADLAPTTVPPGVETANGSNESEPARLHAGLAEATSNAPATPTETASRPARGRARSIVAVAALLVIGVTLAYWRYLGTRPAESTTARPGKSIAVLPFDNLSDDKQNSYFAVAVQDEILTNLAQIADLKVISRMSADSYPTGRPRKAREIGQELGVANLVEGSVQHVGDHIRIHVQLIDTRTDFHLWAQTYDRELRDIFTLQNEIATSIADQLRAKISPSEKAAIEQPSTRDLRAATLYAEALDLEGWPSRRAVDLLEQAVARDPQFVPAYCELVKAHVLLYFQNEDHTESRLEAANAALQSALRLQAQAGEVHLAAAVYAYLGLRDFDRARAELELGRRKLPNSAELYLLTGQIDRRQGRWNESVRNLERAVELEPRSHKYTSQLAVTHEWLRHYRDAERLFDRGRALAGPGRGPVFEAAFLPLYERADLTRVRAETLLAWRQRPIPGDALESMFRVALFDHDAPAMERVVSSMPAEGMYFGNFGVANPREWFAAVGASSRGDNAAAQSLLQTARERTSAATQQQADLPGLWAVLSRIDAALGRTEDAIREAQRASELLPVSKDAMYGPTFVTNLAAVCAAIGDKDRALEQLAISARLPGGIHYGELKLDPAWDPLRDDRRFAQIVASLAPK